MIAGPLTWLVAFGLYVLFAGTISMHEIVVAAVLASMATVWAIVIRYNAEQSFTFRADAIVPVARATLQLAPATLTTLVRLLTATAGGTAPGHFATELFHFGRDDPPERFRRAAAVLAASLTPECFVVRIHKERDGVTNHRIGASRRAPDPQWLQ